MVGRGLIADPALLRKAVGGPAASREELRGYHDELYHGYTEACQSEVQVLFKIMRELNAQGISIVYISHRLEEIMEIGDHVTILRDGKYVDDAAVKDIDVPWIVQKMTGSNKSYPKKERDIDWEKQDTVLEVKDLCLPKKGGGWLLDHVSFKLKRGEILGIYAMVVSIRHCGIVPS